MARVHRYRPRLDRHRARQPLGSRPIERACADARTRDVTHRETRPNVVLLRGLDPQQGAGILVGQYVQQPIRSLTDVAYALMQLVQHLLAADLLPLVVEDDPLDVARAVDLALTHRAHEHIVLPGWKLFARVEGHTRGRNRRHPEDDRQLHPFFVRNIRLVRPGVLTAIADDRPAVVA